MPYPKPLSEKSIARLYDEARLKEKQIEFLHTFFSACANLYGVIFAEDAWKVYRELSAQTETAPLRRRDMYAALGIMRRENLPFYVFEVDEVYSEEIRKDGARIIVHRELVGSGYGKFYELYKVEENSAGKPFYVPKNLLSFTAPPESIREQTLLRFLNGLKSTRSKYTDKYGKIHTCPYKGKFLREFSYISESDSSELEWLNGKIEGLKGNPKKAEQLEAKLKSVTAARYLVDKIKRKNSVGYEGATALIDSFFEDLTAMGVMLFDRNQAETLLQAIYDMCNNQHLWCNRGWTPTELSSRMRGSEMPTVSFGPGLRKAFADGTMNKDEIVSKLHEMGLKTE